MYWKMGPEYQEAGGLHQTGMQRYSLEERGEEGGLGRKINVSLSTSL